MFKEFKEFIVRGNVIDLAVGVIIGGVFNRVVQSLVNDVIMPPIGLLLGRVDFTNLFLLLSKGDPAPPYATLAEAQEAGAVVISYGMFINTVIALIITGFAVFLVVRAINRLQREKEAPAEPTTKTCPHCYTKIPIQATRCPNCTTELEGAPA